MCYNCGCGMPNNDMGNPKNITSKNFEEAAAAMGQSVKDAQKNAHRLLERVLAAQEKSNDKNWKTGGRRVVTSRNPTFGPAAASLLAVVDPFQDELAELYFSGRLSISEQGLREASSDVAGRLTAIKEVFA